MSSSSSSFLVGIGPSGTSQLTVPLTTPTTTSSTSSTLFVTITTTITTTTSFPPTSTMSSTSSTAATASPSSTPSAVSRTPNLGAIIGGAVGGVVALAWLFGLLYFAHRHSWFRRPGYKRQKDEKGMFTKRSPAATPTTESAGLFPDRPQPQTGLGARTFGEPPRPSVYGGEAPRSSAYGGEAPKGPPPPRPIFGQPSPAPPAPPPKSIFNDLPAPRASTFGDRPRSSFGERPISGFGDRDRPRSGFGDRRSLSQDFSRRVFGSVGGLGRSQPDPEWEGAGKRINYVPDPSDMEQRGGLFSWFTRAKDHAAQRRRVQAEYEEDMRKMRGRSAVESDYSRY